MKMEQQRVALVTGANRGIGLEISRRLAARGLRVVMSGRDLPEVEQAAAGGARGPPVAPRRA
jgi:NAD(P)-dependent dehydrogenase (short-subunit alcohol dehydrogenase family)